MPMRKREEVPPLSRPRYTVTQLTEVKQSEENGELIARKTRTFYVVDMHDKARVIWKVSAGHPNSRAAIRARHKAESIARQMNSGYERGLHEALNAK